MFVFTAQKYSASSPHTPPLVPRKPTLSAYQNSPIDVDANSSGSHSHSHSHYRSPGNSYQCTLSHVLRRPVLTSKCHRFYGTVSGSSRRHVASYSPSHSSSTTNKRRRADRYDRSSDYHYSSKRNSDSQNHRHSRERVTESYDLTSSSSRQSSSNRKRRAVHSPSPNRPSKRHSRSHSPRPFRSAASPPYYSSRSNRNRSGRFAASAILYYNIVFVAISIFQFNCT